MKHEHSWEEHWAKLKSKDFCLGSLEVVTSTTNKSCESISQIPKCLSFQLRNSDHGQRYKTRLLDIRKLETHEQFPNPSTDSDLTLVHELFSH